MNFSQLGFFEKVCRDGFSEACREFQCDPNRGLSYLQELQRCLGFVLFEGDDEPSRETLSSEGRSFFPSARRLVDSYVSGILDVHESNQRDDILVVRSTFSYGKNLLLPCIAKMTTSKDWQHVGIDLITQKRVGSNDNAEAHVLFMNYRDSDYLFFDRKWTLVLSQGLYASEGYLLDIGNYPKTPEDLSSHSILGYGDVFDRDAYKRLNWHLSGEYGLSEMEPSILISSPGVITAAVEANLGIGPVVDSHVQFGYQKLFKVLPEVTGPPIVLDFAVRKKIPPKLGGVVHELNDLMLKEADKLELRVDHRSGSIA
ncbi:MAG: hypothetical protein LBF65_00010 [Holosporales bacterium]|nr:hypothetical protein [Holosporales bacterium]